MPDFQYTPGDALRILLIALFCVFALWWFWMGARGTWMLARRFIQGRPASTLALLVVTLGWNVGLGIAITFVCLGAFTLLAARSGQSGAAEGES